jgi:hypothetical protein
VALYLRVHIIMYWKILVLIVVHVAYYLPETVVTVNALPSISVTPSAASVCNPGSPSVSLAASGGISYTWAPAATLNSSTLATVTATPITTTTYTVTGTDANNCTATATASITYNAGVNLTSVTASPASVCSGSK